MFSKTFLPVLAMLNYVAKLTVLCEPSVLASLANGLNFTVIGLLGLFPDTDGLKTLNVKCALILCCSDFLNHLHI